MLKVIEKNVAEILVVIVFVVMYVKQKTHKLNTTTNR